MNSFLRLALNRRTTRKYTGQLLSQEYVESILKVALVSPTSKNKHPWEFIAVEDKETLKQLALCKKTAKSLETCVFAVVVIADTLISDVWIEDASIASIMMQMQAEDLGLGSCWIQIRERFTEYDDPSDSYIKNILDIPMQYQVLSIITFGYKEKPTIPIEDDKILWEKIHINKF